MLSNQIVNLKVIFQLYFFSVSISYSVFNKNRRKSQDMYIRYKCKEKCLRFLI